MEEIVKFWEKVELGTKPYKADEGHYTQMFILSGT